MRLTKSTTDLEEGAKWFNETAAAKDDDPPLLIAMGSIGQLSNLYAINAAAKGEKTRRNKSGTLYTTYSRTVNDMIQYVLYHRAFQS